MFNGLFGKCLDRSTGEASLFSLKEARLRFLISLAVAAGCFLLGTLWIAQCLHGILEELSGVTSHYFPFNVVYCIFLATFVVVGAMLIAFGGRVVYSATREYVACNRAKGLAVERMTTAELLSRLDQATHSVVISELARRADPHAVPQFISALEDRDWHLRERAGKALGRLRDRRAIEPLILALKDECDDEKQRERTRSAMAKALGRITGRWFFAWCRGADYGAWQEWSNRNTERLAGHQGDS